VEEKIVSIMVRKVPETLRRAFKAKCAEQAVDMSGQIIALMTEWVKGGKPKK
jgi:hypothetical protein